MSPRPGVPRGFVDPEGARRATAGEIAAGPSAGDPAFASWAAARPGDPALVHDLAGRPSYWLVPVMAGGEEVGSVRVLADGRAVAATVSRGAPVTALDAGEALRRAAGVVDREAGEEPGSVSLVHDGPPGREAWRVEVLAGGRPSRWVFVTPAGLYQRPAGEVPEPELERGDQR